MNLRIKNKIVNQASINLLLRKIVYLLFTQKRKFLVCVAYVNKLSFSRKSNF